MRILQAFLSWLWRAIWAAGFLVMTFTPKELELALAAAPNRIAAYLEWIGWEEWAENTPIQADAWLTVALAVVAVLYVGRFAWKWWLRRDPNAKAIQKKSERAHGAPHEPAPPFDLPIREAIDHIVRTAPHSYRDDPDLFAFRAIHKEVCAGKLRAVGAKQEGAGLRRICRWHCKRLKPVRVVVPKNPSTPHGVRFDLIKKSKDVEPQAETGKQRGFTDIRFRSADFYRLWPKIHEDHGGAYPWTRFMKASKRGTVNAAYPYRGL